MPAGSPRPGLRVFRPEIILAAAITAVFALAITLTLMLWNGERLHSQTIGTIAIARGARDEMLSLMQALAQASEARRARAATDLFAQAETHARGRAAALVELSAPDAEVAAEAARVAALVDSFFSPTVPVEDVLGELSGSFANLRALLNARNDAARVRENNARVRLATLSVSLALLAMAAAALAAFTLRRERAQWRLAHAEAEQARAKAAASDMAKTRFLAVASHDMRQPLHALTLYLSALERRVEGAEARDILAKMERATRSMVGMFATLLDLARIQAGVVTPQIVEFELQDVIDRIVAEHPGGSVGAPPSAIRLHSDPALIEQVLRNLVINALKHGGGHAEIEVEARNAHVELSVVDHGPGIAAEDQERMFEEFVRLESRGGVEGLGLGLAIVKRICGLLGMPLELKSAPGAGARFTIRAPRSRGLAQPAEGDIAGAVLTGAAVLVIDDDQLARDAIAGALRDAGADVRAGSNEDSAMAILDAGFAPALLLTDLRIDGALRGIDIAQRIRAALSPAPNVLVVTGDTGAETLAALRESGFAWLIKPVDPQQLTAAAAAQLGAVSAT